jgi:NAD(P)-dependent dehydrogenase (short-subunit alcohol dehydrogenase family)
MPINSLVIGASRGLGLALVKALRTRGDTVFATVRSPPAPDAFPPGTRVIQGVDVGERDAGEKIVQGLAGEKVGLVIVNAGYFKSEVRFLC